MRGIVVIGSGEPDRVLSEEQFTGVDCMTLHNAVRRAPWCRWWFYDGGWKGDKTVPVGCSHIGNLNGNVREWYPEFGASTAFAEAAIWAVVRGGIHRLGFIGCDMQYHGERNSFYGKSNPDPILQGGGTPEWAVGMTHKLWAAALERGIEVFNLSESENSLLPFPRRTIGNFLE